ncbi:ABC transporter ATP-binding protein [Nocardioides daejeonensis]|uniref:ABC transporter ATP-binding protein n=1 Tax=Nocardioides daejeonensis TaxID=1046556 RepID=UPI000D7493A7|nr:ABC transporter ATP-binding protein [Nocardioides daejeonensis]
MNAHLEARGVACGRGRRTVVAGVDLRLARGSRLAVVGPNGAGKSTLLRALAGLDRPHAGEVRLDGIPLGELGARARARALAIVSQHETPPADLLVQELVGLGRLPHRSPWATDDGQEWTERALARLDLTSFATRSVDQLSGGELRRVLVARALAQEADLLMLDEPTNHLDLRHQHELLATIRGLGVTVVAAIHDLDLAQRYFDQVALVHGGRLAAVGTPEEVLSTELVGAAFGVRSVRVRHPESGRTHLLVEPWPGEETG